MKLRVTLKNDKYYVEYFSYSELIRTLGLSVFSLGLYPFLLTILELWSGIFWKNFVNTPEYKQKIKELKK